MSALSRAVGLHARHNAGTLLLRSQQSTTSQRAALYSRHFSQINKTPLGRPAMALNRAILMQRHMHIRALSFSSLPKAVLRSFRMPTYIFTAAGGAFAYANYKVVGELI
jgi:hypothetical protein